MTLFGSTLGVGTWLLLFLCLGIALAFEFVNGFHDTANAVATVIYSKSLKPGYAVFWSGTMNLLGVLVSSGAVAFGIVHLLPVDLLIHIGQGVGILMVISVLLSALAWNVGTWYMGLPASSSHALIGSILGIGVASSLMSGKGIANGVNWGKALETGGSLLLSPVIGFVLAGLLLLVAKAFLRMPELYQEPLEHRPPPWWIRLILIGTCTGVSYAHGSNDGQKGIGLVMLILVGFLPAQFAVNTHLNATRVQATSQAIQQMEAEVQAVSPGVGEREALLTNLASVRTTLASHGDLNTLSNQEKQDIRATILSLDDKLNKFAKTAMLPAKEVAALKKQRSTMMSVVDFVQSWVIYAVALALGVGTTIGWKRIVVTVGEKIGKTHLTYAQGAAAEIIAMLTIMGADRLGLPVSTTHVLSSGVAGTMVANRSGIQPATVRNIATAWLLTLPVTMLLSGLIFSVCVASTIKSSNQEPARPVAVNLPAYQRVIR